MITLKFFLEIGLLLPIFSAVEDPWREEWRSTAKMSIEQLEKKINSNQWHWRSSALLQLQQKDNLKAIKAARKLIKDPALVVRSYAAQILIQSNAASDKKLLKTELFSDYNFNKGKSLFIRKQIINGLDRNELMQESELLNRLLQDEDSDIVSYVKLLKKESGKE